MTALTCRGRSRTGGSPESFPSALDARNAVRGSAPVPLGGSQERTRATVALHEGLPARDVLGSAVELVRVVLADLPYTARGWPGSARDGPVARPGLVQHPEHRGPAIQVDGQFLPGPLRSSDLRPHGATFARDAPRINVRVL